MKPSQLSCLALSVILLPWFQVTAQEEAKTPENVHEFQSKKGTKLRALVIGVDDDGNALLQRYSPTKVPLKSLSDEDQAFLNQWKIDHAKEVAWVKDARLTELYKDPGIRAIKGNLRFLDDDEWVVHEPKDPNDLQFVVYYFSQEPEQDGVIGGLSDLYKKLSKRSNHVECVYMSLGSGDKKVKDYVAREGFEFPVMVPSQSITVMRTDPIVSSLFKGTYPQLVVVDRRGQVIADSFRTKEDNGHFSDALNTLEKKVREFQRSKKSKE